MDFFLFADGTSFPPAINSGATLLVYVRYRFLEEITRPIFPGFTLKTKEGVTVYGTNTEMGDVTGKVPEGVPGHLLIVRFETALPCGAGDYFLSVGLASRDVDGEVIPHDRRYDLHPSPCRPAAEVLGSLRFSRQSEPECCQLSTPRIQTCASSSGAISPASPIPTETTSSGACSRLCLQQRIVALSRRKSLVALLTGRANIISAGKGIASFDRSASGLETGCWRSAAGAERSRAFSARSGPRLPPSREAYLAPVSPPSGVAICPACASLQTT